MLVEDKHDVFPYTLKNSAIKKLKNRRKRAKKIKNKKVHFLINDSTIFEAKNFMHDS